MGGGAGGWGVCMVKGAHCDVLTDCADKPLIFMSPPKTKTGNPGKPICQTFMKS